MLKAKADYLDSGMDPSDARMEAVKDWLMFDPNAGVPQEAGAATTA